MPDEDLLEGLTVDDLTDGLEAPEGATPEAAAEYAQSVDVPTQLGGGVQLQQPAADRPWYEQLGQNLSESPLAAPVRSYLENAGNTALSGTADEIGASYLNPQPTKAEWNTFEADARQQPDPNTYAAGSRFEDNRETLETEKEERDAENPVSSTLGQVSGAIAQGARLPTNVLGATAAGAGLTGAQLMGEADGDLGERAQESIEQVQKHPVQTGLAVAAPAIAAGLGKGASAVAGGLKNKAAENTVAAFTTPSQRAAIAENKGGQQAVQKLGQDVRDMGLHEQPWYKFFLPPNAETFYKNAAKARTGANEAMGTAEDAIVAAGNPAINTGRIADDLDQSADQVSQMWDKSAAGPEAAFRREQATGLRRPQPVETDEGLEALLTQEDAPFSEALQNRRYYDQNINYDARGGYEGAGMKEKVRRQIANQLRGSLDEGLEGAVSRGEVPEQPVRDWQKAKKEYSTAAAVEDPALAKMQSEYGGSMGLKDLAGASLFSSMGAPALMSAGTAKTMQGRWPGFMANQQARTAGVAQGVSDAAPGLGNAVREANTPIAQAQAENPEAPQAVVEQKANESLKTQLQEAVKQGVDWFQGFLD